MVLSRGVGDNLKDRSSSSIITHERDRKGKKRFTAIDAYIPPMILSEVLS